MNNETITLKDLENLFISQMNIDVLDLLTHSSNLSLMLLNRNIPLDKFRTKTFNEDASFFYALAREIGDPLPFSTLVVYISAFIDILEERLKE